MVRAGCSDAVSKHRDTEARRMQKLAEQDGDGILLCGLDSVVLNMAVERSPAERDGNN